VTATATPSTVKVGETVTFKGTASPTVGLKYLKVFDSATGQQLGQEGEQLPLVNGTTTWKPQKAGTYKIWIWAYNELGEEVYGEVTVTVNAAGPVLTITGNATPATVTLGQSVTISGSVNDPSLITTIRVKDSKGVQIGKNLPRTGGSVTFTPTSVGTHTLYVGAYSAGGARIKHTPVTVTVKKPELVVTGKATPTTVKLGQSVAIEGSVNDFTQITTIRVMDSDNVQVGANLPRTGGSVTFTPKTVGTHTLYVGAYSGGGGRIKHTPVTVTVTAGASDSGHILHWAVRYNSTTKEIEAEITPTPGFDGNHKFYMVVYEQGNPLYGGTGSEARYDAYTEIPLYQGSVTQYRGKYFRSWMAADDGTYPHGKSLGLQPGRTYRIGVREDGFESHLAGQFLSITLPSYSTSPPPERDLNALKTWLKGSRTAKLQVSWLVADSVYYVEGLNWEPKFGSLAAVWDDRLGWAVPANHVTTLWPGVGVRNLTSTPSFENYMGGLLPSIEASAYPRRVLSCSDTANCSLDVAGNWRVSLSRLIETFHLKDYQVLNSPAGSPEIRLWPVYPTVLVHGWNVWNGEYDLPWDIPWIDAKGKRPFESLGTQAKNYHITTVTRHMGPEVTFTDGANYVYLLIDWLRDKTGARKVNIVAHSKGGLVVRYMIADKGRVVVDQIDKVITVDTPHRTYSGLKSLWLWRADLFNELTTLANAEWPRSYREKVKSNQLANMHPVLCWAGSDEATARCEYDYSQMPISTSYVGNSLTWVLYQADTIAVPNSWPSAVGTLDSTLLSNNGWGALMFRAGNQCSRMRDVKGTTHGSILEFPSYNLIVTDLLAHDVGCQSTGQESTKRNLWVLRWKTTPDGQMTFEGGGTAAALEVYGENEAPNWNLTD
ncbi:MAG TPA: alpha/beta fold hydrolase, partial [Symbiobacteriaceae bacterium]|nr:alpha/beta fold hydrolase [Symbiobacteriaceae bacterium]